jgi:hypothetical protein
VDFNNDGKKDLISGDTKGQVWFFNNIGTDEAPVLAAGVRVESDGKPILGIDRVYQNGKFLSDPSKLMGIYSKIDIADYNDDGLVDVLIGHTSPAGHDVVVYYNIGTKTVPTFGPPEALELPEPKMSRPSPFLIDWDKDGVNDLLFGTDRSMIYFFKNMGTNKKPEYDSGKEIKLIGFQFDKGYRARFDVNDWNNDGKMDLLVGNAYRINNNPTYGNVWLFLAE